MTKQTKIYIKEIAFEKFLKRNQHLFIDKTLDLIFIENRPYYNFADYSYKFNEYEFDEKIKQKIYWDKNATEDVELDLDTEVTLKIGNIYISLYYCKDSFKYPNKTPTKITIADKLEENLLNISHYFSKNCINQKIKKIYSNDYFDINFLLENGYTFNINRVEGYNTYIIECKFMPLEPNIVNYDILQSYHFEKYSDLNVYINKIKQFFVGKKINKIMRLGHLYDLEDKRIELDEFIDIEIEGKHLNIDFVEESDVYIGVNLFSYKETDYYGRFSWRNISPIYKENIINQTIKDIILIKQDTSVYAKKEYARMFEDKFNMILVILGNGYALKLSNYHDYLILDEIKYSNVI